MRLLPRLVAPFAGAWIETAQPACRSWLSMVAPFAGARFIATEENKHHKVDSGLPVGEEDWWSALITSLAGVTPYG